MPDLDDLLTKRNTTAGPAQPITAPPVTGATPYGAAALAGEVANLLAVPVGSGRNDQLNRSAVKMYGLAAAGQISERDVTETLGAADGGLQHPATARTLRSARDAVFGRLGARHVPEPTRPATPPATTGGLAPWEQSDDPLGDGYVPPATPPAHATSSATGSTTSAGEPTSTTSPTSPADAASPSTPGSVPPSDSSTGDADAAYAALVKVEADRVRLNRDARRLIDQEDAARAFRVPPYLPTLTAELALPDEPVTYRVDRLIPTGGNVLLAAQYKTGKTTFVNNLTRALVDGVPFLDRYDVADLAGRVALFNYEVDGRQYRRWLRDLGIVNTDAVALLNLRGYRLPLLVPHVEDWVVEWLQRAEASVWIVDPFARAATGIDENSNTEVGTMLDTLDVIKDRAGVGELILPTHTGRAEHDQGDERARGATRLDDWADVRWLLTRDKQDVRYFRATGRDVEVDEAALAYDPDTRHLTMTGGDRRANAQTALREAILTCIENRPGIGLDLLRRGVRSIVGTASNDRIKDEIASLMFDRLVHVERSGHAQGHYLGAGPDARNDPLNE